MVPQPMELSVVIPVYNEEDNVEPLVREIEASLAAMGKSYEVVIVDDGSSDTTLSRLKGLQAHSQHLKVIGLKRNFGQTAALAAGLAEADGNVVILMDGDGQNDPADIPALLQTLDDGYDLVAGWRHDRKDDFFSKRLPSMLANRLIARITRVPLHDSGCTLKAMRREVAKNLRLYGEMHRFIPAIAFERGAKIAELKVNHRPRLHGKSKYRVTRVLRVLLDLLTVRFLNKYATRPAHLFGSLGLCGFGLGLLTGLYLGVQKVVFDHQVSGRPLLLISLLLMFFGVQFLAIGLLGELLTRTYHEAQGRPVYVVREVLETTTANVAPELAPHE